MLKKLYFILALVLLIGCDNPQKTTTQTSSAAASPSTENIKLTVPAWAVTQCRDGSYSRSSGRGTCSHHGGVDHYITADERRSPEERAAEEQKKAAEIEKRNAELRAKEEPYHQPVYYGPIDLINLNTKAYIQSTLNNGIVTYTIRFDPQTIPLNSVSLHFYQSNIEVCAHTSSNIKTVKSQVGEALITEVNDSFGCPLESYANATVSLSWQPAPYNAPVNQSQGQGEQPAAARGIIKNSHANDAVLPPYLQPLASPTPAPLPTETPRQAPPQPTYINLSVNIIN